MERLTLMDIVRAADLAILPPQGAWVCVKGLPRSPRIIPAHAGIGIQHLDIYWGYKEVLAFTLHVDRLRRPHVGLVEAVYYEVSHGVDSVEALARVADELRQYVKQSPFPRAELQTTLITISHPHPEEVRFFNGELLVLEAEFVRRLLEEDLLQPVTFAASMMPVLDDAVREIVEALQIDGLSKAEAYQMVVAADVIEPEEQFVPTWYYRPVGELRELFVETEAP